MSTRLLKIKISYVFHVYIGSNGVKVRGYFAWSAFDTYEFNMGYSGNWGLYHVDFNNNLKRVATAAAEWYRKFLTTK